jgi:hypothetical protein
MMIFQLIKLFNILSNGTISGPTQKYNEWFSIFFITITITYEIITITITYKIKHIHKYIMDKSFRLEGLKFFCLNLILKVSLIFLIYSLIRIETMIPNNFPQIIVIFRRTLLTVPSIRYR